MCKKGEVSNRTERNFEVEKSLLKTTGFMKVKPFCLWSRRIATLFLLKEHCELCLESMWYQLEGNVAMTIKTLHIYTNWRTVPLLRISPTGRQIQQLHTQWCSHSFVCRWKKLQPPKCALRRNWLNKSWYVKIVKRMRCIYMCWCGKLFIVHLE